MPTLNELGVIIYCKACQRHAEICSCADTVAVLDLEAYIPLAVISETEKERLRRETLEVNTVDGPKKLDPIEEEPPIEGDAVELPVDRFPQPGPDTTVDGDEIDPELKELMEQEGGFGQ